MRADQARYDNVWSAILAEPVEKAAVAALCKYALEKQAGCRSHPLQLNRAFVASVEPVAIVSGFAEERTGHRQGKVCRLLSALVNVSAAMPVSAGSFSCCNTREGLLDCGLDGVLDANAPVRSMDQLFCQAIALSPILITKAQCWAAVSGGYFCSALTDAVRCSMNRGTGSSNSEADGNNGGEAGDSEHFSAGFDPVRAMA